MIYSDMWGRFNKYLFCSKELGLSLDISMMEFEDPFLERMEPAMQRAFFDMAKLEKGAIANHDEGRMVGHYWLRTPELAPSDEICNLILETVEQIKRFATDIHTGVIRAENGELFKNLLVIGIGGSALGPQFLADSLSSGCDKMKPYFLDNSDPDGMDHVFETLGKELKNTLTIVISKSGATKETRNGMLETEAVYKKAGLEFAKHAVAITGEASELANLAKKSGWLERFPMWDWVGGRTSLTSAVGLLPAALQGVDIKAFLAGAKSCDLLTRKSETMANPAAIMALMWHYATDGCGNKDMVLLPYKDRLLFFSRYLQQLIMESIGKELDKDGTVVQQGLTVYGNKGSTDQHAYVQQLREGVDNFFVTFIEVLKDRNGNSIEVEDAVTSGDFLFGFLQGTRKALYEKWRKSMTITITEINPFNIGVLVALFERAVGLYATLVNINAYHQPGVEAGKKAAGEVIKLQKELIAMLRNEKEPMTAEEAARAINASDNIELVFALLRRLAFNGDRGIKLVSDIGTANKWTFAASI